MTKTPLTLTALAIAALGFQPRPALTAVGLKEETMTLEYTATADELVVIFDAESEEPLDRVEIRNPRGVSILKLRGESGQRLSLSGFTIESQEADFPTIFATYPEGMYDIRARTVEGWPAIGAARLSHEMLPAPVVTFPREGDVNVPTTNLTVTWTASPDVSKYRLVLEQDENDGLIIELPPGSSSFQVPNGFLKRDTETQLEVGAVGANGNCTLVEVVFTTS